MYEKISGPRNDELMVINSFRTIEHSRTVGTLPYLNDQTPGKSVDSFYELFFPFDLQI
jgi:hypothetical protein